MILLNLVKRVPLIQNRCEIPGKWNCDGETKNYVVKEFDNNYDMMYHEMKLIINLSLEFTIAQGLSHSVLGQI